MPALKNDKFREYARYAEYCLNMVASTRDQELRCAQREMAAEWLNPNAYRRNPMPKDAHNKAAEHVRTELECR